MERTIRGSTWNLIIKGLKVLQDGVQMKIGDGLMGVLVFGMLSKESLCNMYLSLIFTISLKRSMIFTQVCGSSAQLTGCQIIGSVKTASWGFILYYSWFLKLTDELTKRCSRIWCSWFLAIPTHSSFIPHRVTIASSCPMCGNEPKTIIHDFVLVPQ